MRRTVSIAAMLAAVASFAAEPEKNPLKPIAERVVVDVAAVQGGEVVFVSGNDLEFVEEITLAVQRHGGLPLQLYSRPQAERRYYDEVPGKYDAKAGDLWLKLAELPAVVISVGGMLDADVDKGVAAERLATLGQSYQRGNERLLKRNVRQIDLGNGMYPTEANAKRLGVAKAELESIFKAGVATDPAKLAASGEAIRASVAKGKELRITAPNGTDLTMKVEGRPVLVSDGVISADEAKKGGPAAMVFLPAGEAYLAPVAGSAKGKLIVDKAPFRSGAIEGFTATIAAGKMTAVTAKASAEFTAWKEIYEKEPACRDLVAAVDFGLNPDVKAKSSKPLLTFTPAGMVSVFFGGDTWAGGTNDCAFQVGGFLPGATVTVDGKVLVDKGVLRTGG